MWVSGYALKCALMLMSTCVCVFSFSLTEQVPPLHVKDRCSSRDERGESGEERRLRRPTNWNQLFSTHCSSFDMMYSLLNFSTHLEHFSKPLRRTEAIFLAAKLDSYVPREDSITSVWPGQWVVFLKIALAR